VLTANILEQLGFGGFRFWGIQLWPFCSVVQMFLIVLKPEPLMMSGFEYPKGDV